MSKINLFLLFSVLFSIVSFSGCNDGPDDPGTRLPIEFRRDAYGTLNEEFEKDALLTNFIDQSDGTYAATLSTGIVVYLDQEMLSLVMCTPAKWPAVKVVDGRWSVNGRDTGIEKRNSNTTVAAAVYDTEGLYVWTESGRIIFFHRDRVRQIGCFRFNSTNNSSLTKDIVCLVEGNKVSASLPVGTSGPNLVATVAYRGVNLKIGNEVQDNGVTVNNFTSQIVYTIERKNSANINFTVDILGFKHIPIIRIATEGGAPIVSKDDYINATLTIEDPDKMYSESADAVTLATEIRGRGNSTWGMPKKPYKIKLDKKNSLLGMTTDKEWALLANYSDKTFLRNTIAFDISRRLGLMFTPDMRPVEVYLNNAYQGVYMLCEQVKVSAERVNIEVVGSGDNDGEAVTGGYFLEIDSRHDADVWFDTSHNLPIVFKEPKLPTSAQLAYLKGYFKDAETALYGPDFADPVNGYAKYIDVKSFVYNYIVQELTKNVDGNMRLSGYLVKTRGGKIAHSNVWDFDIALGNCDYISTEYPGITNDYKGFYIKERATWYDRLFEDPAFVAQVKKEWNAFYPQIANSSQNADMLSVLLDEAQKRNFTQWPILNEKVWPNLVVMGSYRGEVDYLRKFLDDRAKWLNGEIQKW